MSKKEFDGFSVNIFLDDDGDWVAHFIELPNVSACGSNVDEALRELKIAWEGVKKSYRQHGENVPLAPSAKKYSGHFNVRIDKRLHRNLAMEACVAGLSLNALISQKLACG
ncbi:MAG: type II toxin-antitoxin system HicB family antitoxin [Gammaproteobacteria bacterium]